MLVDIQSVKFKDGAYFADVSLYDEVSYSEVLVLFGFGFASNPMNASKGFLLEASNGNHFLLAVDDYKKEEAKQDEVMMYNSEAMVKLTQSKKVSLKNNQYDLKRAIDEIYEVIENLSEAVGNAITVAAAGVGVSDGGAMALGKMKSSYEGFKGSLDGKITKNKSDIAGLLE